MNGFEPVYRKIFDYTKAENTKLRKLADELWTIAYDNVEDKSELDSIRYKMYELGIGLDNEEQRLDFQHKKLLEIADRLQEHGTFVGHGGVKDTDPTMCEAATAMRVAADTLYELKDRLAKCDSTNGVQE